MSAHMNMRHTKISKPIDFYACYLQDIKLL